MKLSKNLKVIISVLVAFIMAMVVTAAVLPFATNIAHADSGQVEFELSLVNYDGTEYEGEADFSDEYDGLICVQVKLINGVTFVYDEETYTVSVTTYTLKMSYDDSLLELQTTDSKITGSNVVVPGEMPIASSVTDGVISVSGVLNAGIETDFVAFTMLFKVASGATTGASSFALSDLSVGNASGFGEKDVNATTVLSASGISAVDVHEASEDATAKNNTITVKKVDADDNPTGDALAVTYNSTTKTFTLDNPVEYLTTKLYVEVEANNAYATVGGLDTDADKVKTISWGAGTNTSATISNAFTITAEKNGSTPVIYNIAVTRNAASDDVSASFELKGATTAENKVSLVKGTANYSMPEEIENADKDEVEFIFAPTVNAASMKVEYLKSGDSTPTAVTTGEKVALTSGDYTATIKVNSEAAIVNGTTYDDTSPADVATYTVTFTVAKSSDISATLEIKAGTTAMGIDAVYSKNDLDTSITDTVEISNEIAYSKRKNVTFTFAANDSTAKSAVLKYQKGAGAEVTATSEDEVELENGTYNLTLTVTAEDDTVKAYSFTLKVKDPDSRTTLQFVKLEKSGETTLTATYDGTEKTYTFTQEIALSNRNGWSLVVEKDFSGQEVTLPDDATSLALNAGKNEKTITVQAEDESVAAVNYTVVINLSGGLKLSASSSLYFATFDTTTKSLVPLADPKECKDVPDGKTVYIAGFTKAHTNVPATGYGYVTRENLYNDFENNSNVKIFDSSNTELATGTDRITTNTSVCLMEGTTKVQTVKVIILGDVNCDGYINANDIAWLQLYTAGHVPAPAEYEVAATDTNQTGANKGVWNAQDIVSMQEHLLKINCLYV